MSLVLLVALGIAIGVLLGAVGGGGSLVAVPALVYVGDQGVRAAQAGALVVVIAAAAIGSAAYLRRGQVRWRAGLAFGAAAGVGSFAGSLLSRALDPDLLLLIFTPVMLAGAAAMIGERARAESSFRPWRLGVSSGAAVRVTVLGLGVGWLTGLFGVGGGFLIVPALVLALGFEISEAVGTSLLAVILGSAVALAERLQAGGIEWDVVLPFALAAVLGVLLGSSVVQRVSREALTRAFAAIVVLVALFTAAESLATLL